MTCIRHLPNSSRIMRSCMTSFCRVRSASSACATRHIHVASATSHVTKLYGNLQVASGQSLIGTPCVAAPTYYMNRLQLTSEMFSMMLVETCSCNMSSEAILTLLLLLLTIILNFRCSYIVISSHTLYAREYGMSN